RAARCRARLHDVERLSRVGRRARRAGSRGRRDRRRLEFLGHGARAIRGTGGARARDLARRTLTWGGLARPLEEGAGALADRLQPYVGAGAAWIILGPVDAGDPANSAVLGEVRAR